MMSCGREDSYETNQRFVHYLRISWPPQDNFFVARVQVRRYQSQTHHQVSTRTRKRTQPCPQGHCSWPCTGFLGNCRSSHLSHCRCGRTYARHRSTPSPPCHTLRFPYQRSLPTHVSLHRSRDRDPSIWIRGCTSIKCSYGRVHLESLPTTIGGEGFITVSPSYNG